MSCATHRLLPSCSTGTIGAPGTSMKEHLHVSKYVKSQPINKSWAVMTCIRLEIHRSSTALSTPKDVRCQVFDWHLHMQRCEELSRKTRRGWKAKDGRRRQKRGRRFSAPSRQQQMEDGETQLSSGKTCSESGIPYLSFNWKIKCCWGNTSHVNFWTFGLRYTAMVIIFTSLFKYTTKKRQF